MIERRRLLLSALLLVAFGFAAGAQIMKTQNKYKRVREARPKHMEAIVALFKDAGMRYPPREIFLRGFKTEDELELWARASTRDPFTLIKTYTICMKSGVIGPKRRSGDEQVPEGAYYINRYNPMSSFHLSLGLDYPNQSDRVRGYKRNLGGDIFIHGACVTIGCLPLTDDVIEELYLIAVDTHTRQKRVPVHIFPLRMTNEGMGTLKMHAAEDDREGLFAFWEEIRPIYDAFEADHFVPKVRILKDGRYQVRPPREAERARRAKLTEARLAREAAQSKEKSGAGEAPKPAPEVKAEAEAATAPPASPSGDGARDPAPASGCGSPWG